MTIPPSPFRVAGTATTRPDGAPTPLAAAVGSQPRKVVWPVRAGTVPPLVQAFTRRTESVPGIESLLALGQPVVLVPEQETAGHLDGWLRSAGKTQLASSAASSLWESGEVDLLAWVSAASRASVLAGYAEAASLLGLGRGDGDEAAAVQFAAWLRSARRSWLVVLDCLRDPADMAGLWPAGGAGRVIVTACSPWAAGDQVRVVPVGCLSAREAVGYLSERLSTDPDHRAGQLDLALALDCEPAALAHASALIATSNLTCRSYHEIFARHHAQLEREAGRKVPAAAATWSLSVQHAEILKPGAATWLLLVLAALLCGQGIPLAVLTAPAVCRYLGAGLAGPRCAHDSALCVPLFTRPCRSTLAASRARIVMS